MAEDSESEDERIVDSKPSSSKSPVSKPKISPKEEKVVIKQELDAVVQKGGDSGRPPGSSAGTSQSPYSNPFSSIAQASSCRDELRTVQSLGGLTSTTAAAAMLLKNHTSSAASLLSPAEQSVLSYSLMNSSRGISGSDKVGGNVSPLLGHLLKDNDEPLNKKPRKAESPSINLSSPKSKSDTISGANNSLYPFNKMGSGAGFSLLPVSSAAVAASSSLRSITGSQSSSSLNNPESQRTSPVGSALRLASLPGVSLTAVNSRNTQPPVSSHSQKQLSRASLMPPPNSAVTLSPVPRTSVAGTSGSQSPVSNNHTELRCIETGDINSKHCGAASTTS